MPVKKVHKRLLAAAVLMGFSVPLTAATANASVVEIASQESVQQPPEAAPEPVIEEAVEQQAAPEPAAEAAPEPGVEQTPAPAAETPRRDAEAPQPAQPTAQSLTTTQAPVAPASTSGDGDENSTGGNTVDTGDETPGDDGDNTPEPQEPEIPEEPSDPEPDDRIELESGITVDPKVEQDEASGTGLVAIEGDTEGVDISVKDANGNSPEATHEDGRLSIEEYDDGTAYAIHFDQDGQRKSVIIGDGNDTPSQAVEGEVAARQVGDTTTMKLTNLAIGVQYLINFQDQNYEFNTDSTSYEFDWSNFGIDTSKDSIFEFSLTNLLGLHSTAENGEQNLKFGYSKPAPQPPTPEQPEEPADPAEPTDPANPEDPTAPGPIDPVEPGPTEPTEPTEPSVPGEPGGGDGGQITVPGDVGGDPDGGPSDPVVPPLDPDSGAPAQQTGGTHPQEGDEDPTLPDPEERDNILNVLASGSQAALDEEGTSDNIGDAQGQELPYAADGLRSNLLESSPTSSALLESLVSTDQDSDRDDTDDSDLDVFGGPKDSDSEDKSPDTRADAAPVLNASSSWLKGITIAVASSIVMLFAWLILGKSRRGRHSGEA